MSKFGLIDDDDNGKPRYDEVTLWEDYAPGKIYIPHKPCHETHPDMPLLGGTLIGGNCAKHRRHENVDYYVALDGHHEHPQFDGERAGNPPVSVYYPIANMSIPNRVDKFTCLIADISLRLSEGQRVHVGCIGGHGRTGMVFAAVVGYNKLSDDPIAYVREHYCKKAVEAVSQVKFLMEHFGATYHKPRYGKG